MESFSRSTTANSDINTKNDNSWKTMGDIISSTINSIPVDKYAAPITAVEVSFVIHSDWNGYFSTDTRLVIKRTNTTAQHYNTGKFSGDKRRTYKFLINDNDFTIGYLKNNPTQLKLQFKAYRANGQGTLKVYCKSKTVNITYYIGDIPINFESPANEEQFKQYTDEINIRLSKKPDDTNTYTLKIKNAGTSEEIYSEAMLFNDNNIYNKLIGPYNTSQTLTLQCLNNNNNETVAKCQIEIIKNDIFSISPVINRYNLITGENNLYESAFDGEYVVVAVDVTVLAESFLDKNITFTFSAVDDTTNENNPKSVSVEIEKLQKVFSISNLFKKEETSIGSYFKFSSDKNYTVSLIATDNNNNSIFKQNILISPATPILNVDEGGVAIGQFSTGEENNPKFECAYPAIFYAGISYPTIDQATMLEASYYSDSTDTTGLFKANKITPPIDTGCTWVDGKKIYRQVIIITREIPTNINIGFPLSPSNDNIVTINDISSLIRCFGGGKRTNNTFGPIPYIAVSNTSIISMWISGESPTIAPAIGNEKANIYIGTGANVGISSGEIIIEYTKNE